MGMDDRSGTLAIAKCSRRANWSSSTCGDAETSAQDLTAVLDRYAGDNRENQVHGALLFSCLGRGQYLYGPAQPRHRHFPGQAGRGAAGRFFLQRRNRPGQRRHLLHGYTSSFGIFRPKF